MSEHDPHGGDSTAINELWRYLRELEKQVQKQNEMITEMTMAQKNSADAVEKLAKSVKDIVDVWTAASTIGKVVRWASSFLVSLGVVYAAYKGVKVGGS
jgi:hypothetical protein